MKILFSLLALLVLLVPVANATLDANYIGIFDDEDTAEVCTADLTQYVSHTIYFYARMDMVEISQLTAVEFKVGDWATLSANGLLTQNWDTTLVIGEPSTDISLAFTVPRDGPQVFLGSVDIFPTTPDALGDDFRIRVLKGDDPPGKRVIVDELFVTHPVDGNVFTFFCTDEPWCVCNVDAPTQDVNWGAIKSLY